MAGGFLGTLNRRWLIGGLVVIVGVSSVVAWRYFARRESTDDAEVTAHVSPVAARVAGPIKSILVQDNQIVKEGDVLVEIDPRDYQIALDRAQADLSAIQASARAARTGVPLTSTNARSEEHVAETGAGNAQAALEGSEREVEASQAKLDAARARLVEVSANATRASDDLERLRSLNAKNEIPRQQFDAAVSTDAAARAAVDSAKASVREAQANLNVSESKRAQATGQLTQAQTQAKAALTAPQQIALTEAEAASADAKVLQAQAALEAAKVNLERTTVRAPASGVVSRRSLEIAQIVQAGQPLLSITALNEVWVVANFKETQLGKMRPGQRAEVTVDAYGGRTYAAHVDSIAAATGATFSLLPADNASGNFVKVVQRVPVKILMDSAQDAAAVLRPGMSVTATVLLY